MLRLHFIIVVFFAKRNYIVLIRVCVFVCVCVCINYSKSNRSSNKQFKYIVVYENILGKFDNGHCQIKVTVTVSLKVFSIYYNTNYRSYNSTFAKANKLILRMYILLIIMHKIYSYFHALILIILTILQIQREC